MVVELVEWPETPMLFKRAVFVEAIEVGGDDAGSADVLVASKPQRAAISILQRCIVRDVVSNSSMRCSSL